MSDQDRSGAVAGEQIRLIDGDDWQVLAWLWQCFRHDLATVTGGLPYADGRYRHDRMPTASSDDVCGYLAWSPHPGTGELAPIAFATLRGLASDTHHISGFWVAPAARRTGIGRRLAHHVVSSHPGEWAIAFQSGNEPGARFWRRFADEAFGPRGWQEAARPVPGKPRIPSDHWVETRIGTAPTGRVERSLLKEW